MACDGAQQLNGFANTKRVEMDNALSSVFHNTEDLSRQCHCRVLLILFFIVLYAEQFKFNIFYVLNTLLNGNHDFPRNRETCEQQTQVHIKQNVTFILTTTNRIMLCSVINIIFRLCIYTHVKRVYSYII